MNFLGGPEGVEKGQRCLDDGSGWFAAAGSRQHINLQEPLGPCKGRSEVMGNEAQLNGVKLSC